MNPNSEIYRAYVQTLKEELTEKAEQVDSAILEGKEKEKMLNT